MAQWNHTEKLLYAKLVYYGPAFGGKTTTLQTLHRLTDPEGDQRLLSLKTTNDRTLFFDLLPFDLGSILGYRVAMKLYTVPGQVRYETTRQTVLRGADAVVFVADSSSDRLEQNRWSLQNLRMNMRKAGMDPDKTPVLYQFNKQDKPNAARPQQVAAWLNVDPTAGFPTVATEGRGVFETFVSASLAMLARIYEQADERTKGSIKPEELARQVERSLAPYLARAKACTDTTAKHTDEIVLEGDDMLADAVTTQTGLGEQLGEARARLRRKDRELDALRRMSESLIAVGACIEGERVLDAALETAAGILESDVVSLIRVRPGQDPVVERCRGRAQDPLIATRAGTALLARMSSSGASRVLDELVEEFDTKTASKSLDGLRAAACASTGEKSQRYLVAYASQPDGSFNAEDLRFLQALGAHLEVGLDQSRLHQEVASHRDELEKKVEQRTSALRRANEDLRNMEQTKDRLLDNLSHEMRSPLTAIHSAATFIRDYRSNTKQRAELAQSMLESSETLQRYLDQLLRLADADEAASPVIAATNEGELIDAAVGLCSADRIEARLSHPDETLHLDLTLVSRAVSNLLDNAVKFSPDNTSVELELNLEGRGVSIIVSDRGVGVAEVDRERIFAPFEQGRQSLTDKPVGVGMGLYEASKIAKQHGGCIEHENREGGGSHFVLRLPQARINTGSEELEETHA